ncbi:MAG: YpdA family putative bacillithiol disulfide reductase [Bryobacterales bacterium]|nr:YpdA family putative bacillithiol disulfide reductase [Bryobacteraceae bacterium]MDW8131655.1 YpdA family putative bacillithiol disulfide reductase [Bryobacterales bacterium]
MKTAAIVVGAGPTGLACAIELKRAGVEALVLEKGCLLNSIYNYPTHMTFFTTPELLEIGGIPFTCAGEKPTRLEALKYYRGVARHYELRVRQYERVEEIQGEDGDFRVLTADLWGRCHAYSARKVVLATGYYDRPNLLNVPGEELPKVSHYYKEPHPYFDTDVAVIGGRNSAAIASLELYRAGARVTLIHRGETLSDHIKYWIRPDLENRIRNGEIRAYFRSHVLEILPEEIVVQTPQGVIRLENDFVLAMTGYHPDTAFLAALGIRFDPATGRPWTNPETLESARPGIYLAGVVVAGVHTNEIFIENGRHHAHCIARDIAARLGLSSS